MISRLSVAVVVSGLAFVNPASAGMAEFSPELFADRYEAETAALIAADLAKAGDIVLSQLPVIDPPGPLAILLEAADLAKAGDIVLSQLPVIDPPGRLAVLLEQAPTPIPQDTASAADMPASVDALLAPEFFLDPNETETLAQIAAEFAPAEDFVTTGSISADASGTCGLTAQFRNPLTDDAFAMEAHLTP